MAQCEVDKADVRCKSDVSQLSKNRKNWQRQYIFQSLLTSQKFSITGYLRFTQTCTIFLGYTSEINEPFTENKTDAHAQQILPIRYQPMDLIPCY